MEIIKKLMRQCGLGDVTANIEPVSGGFMHRMYKVQTESGTYAVKHLNPEIMKRPDVLSNYKRAEQLEKRLADSGIPIVPSLELNGRKLQELDGGFFYIFKWHDGSITDRNDITAEMCFEAGGILGRIHSIEPREAEAQPAPESRIDWHAYARRAAETDPETAAALEANIPLLEAAGRELDRAAAALPGICCISDEDMDPKNVMWLNGEPVVIDLECLDYGNPASHALQLALQWAGVTTCSLDPGKLSAFMRGYLEAYDNGFRGYRDIPGIAYTWLDWLEYNVRRALGECADEAERRMGVSETLCTIDRIRHISEMTPVIQKTLWEIDLTPYNML